MPITKQPDSTSTAAHWFTSSHICPITIYIICSKFKSKECLFKFIADNLDFDGQKWMKPYQCALVNFKIFMNLCRYFIHRVSRNTLYFLSILFAQWVESGQMFLVSNIGLILSHSWMIWLAFHGRSGEYLGRESNIHAISSFFDTHLLLSASSLFEQTTPCHPLGHSLMLIAGS